MKSGLPAVVISSTCVAAFSNAPRLHLTIFRQALGVHKQGTCVHGSSLGGEKAADYEQIAHCQALTSHDEDLKEEHDLSQPDQHSAHILAITTGAGNHPLQALEALTAKQNAPACALQLH